MRVLLLQVFLFLLSPGGLHIFRYFREGARVMQPRVTPRLFVHLLRLVPSDLLRLCQGVLEFVVGRLLGLLVHLQEHLVSPLLLLARYLVWFAGYCYGLFVRIVIKFCVELLVVLLLVNSLAPDSVLVNDILLFFLFRTFCCHCSSQDPNTERNLLAITLVTIMLCSIRNPPA